MDKLPDDHIAWCYYRQRGCCGGRGSRYQRCPTLCHRGGCTGQVIGHRQEDHTDQLTWYQSFF